MKRMKEIWKQFLLWIGAATLLVTAGCAKAPAEDVAAKKNTDQIVEIALVGNEASGEIAQADNAGLRAAYGIPDRYTAELSGESGRLLLHSDVEITVPGVANMPTVRVEHGRFSQDLVSRMFAVLCGDTPMYLFPEMASKERISTLIAQCKQELAELEAQQGLDASYRVAQTELLTQMLADYEAQYQKAPDKVDLVQTDGTLQTRKLPSSDTNGAPSGTLTVLDAISAPYDDDAMLFSVDNDAVYENTDVYIREDAEGNIMVSAPRSGSTFQYHRAGAMRQMDVHRDCYCIGNVTEQSLSGGTPAESTLSVTPQQARAAVEAFLSAAQIPDMAIMSVYLYESRELAADGSLMPSPSPIPDGSPAKPTYGQEGQCYAVRCVRKVNGVPVESTEAYSEHNQIEWWYESLWFNVDDAGISNIDWMAPLHMTKTEAESTALIPWTQVQEIFEKMFMVAYGSLAQQVDDPVEFTLNRVELSLQRINDEGEYTSGLLVPVWNFYGWYTNNREEPGDEILFPLISINAIDGSVIDVNKGF